jgi:hypothetical protein
MMVWKSSFISGHLVQFEFFFCPPSCITESSSRHSDMDKLPGSSLPVVVSQSKEEFLPFNSALRVGMAAENGPDRGMLRQMAIFS